MITACKPLQMSTGTNGQDAGAVVKQLLRWEIETSISYRPYGNSGGALIVRDIICAAERDFCTPPSTRRSRAGIDSVLVNGICDGMHVYLTHLVGSRQLQTGDTAMVIGHALPYHASLSRELGLKYLECADGDGEMPALPLLRSTAAAHRPKLLFVQLPHNRSGTLEEPAYYRQLMELARELGAHVLVDRVCLMPREYGSPVLAEFYPGLAEGLVAVCDSLSESHNLAGMRGGYFLASRATCEGMAMIMRMRHLNPAIFGSPTLAACLIANVGLVRGLEAVEKYRRLLRRYQRRIFVEYPSDYDRPDLVDALDGCLAAYLPEPHASKTR